MFFFFKQKTAYEMRISDWSSDVCSSDLLEQSRYRPDLEVASHDRPDPLDLLWHRHQLALDHLIAERYRPAHPQALLLRSSDLVADALPGDFALELGKRQQDVQRQPPHAGSRVECLRHRYETGLLRIEPFDDLDRKSTRLKPSHECAAGIP